MNKRLIKMDRDEHPIKCPCCDAGMKQQFKSLMVDEAGKIPVVVAALGSWPHTIPRQAFESRVPSRNFFAQERAAHEFNLHAHQRQAMDWLQSQPDATIMLEGEVAYMDFKLRLSETMPTRAIGFGYPQHQMIINPMRGVPIIEDEYIAPIRPPKDWASNPWIRSAMGGKSGMSLLQSMYRATRPAIYQPEFDWENHSMSTRRKLHTIKHVNVGTVGHIDWGNNRMMRTRPSFPGYLADCIRAAIREFK